MASMGVSSKLVLVAILALAAAAFTLLSAPAMAAPTPQDYDPGQIFNDNYNDSVSALNITANQSQRLLFYLDCGGTGDADWMYMWLPTGRDLHVLLETENGISFRFRVALKTPELFDVVNTEIRPQTGNNASDLQTTTRIAGPYYLALDGIASCVTPPNYYNVTWWSNATAAADDGDNSVTNAATIVSGATISSQLTETTDQADFFKITVTVTPPTLQYLRITGLSGIASGAALEFYNSTGVLMVPPTPVPGWENYNNTAYSLQAGGYRFDASDTFYFRLWSNGNTGPYTLVFNLSTYAPTDTNLDFGSAHAVTDNANVTSYENYTFERSHYWKVFVSTPRTLWIEVFSNEVDVGVRLHSELLGTLQHPPRATRDLIMNNNNNPKDYQSITYAVTAAELANVTGWYFINVTIVDFVPQGNFSVHFYFEDAPVGTAGNYTINEDTNSTGTIDVPARFTDLDCQLNASDPDCALTITMISAPSVNITFGYSGGQYATAVPDANWSGRECAVFRARDFWGLTATAQICVNVLPVNDAPALTTFVPVPPTENMVEDTQLSGILIDTWFFDVDGDTLIYDFTGNSEISVQLNPLSGHTEGEFTPSPNWNGQETITFCADDTQAVVCVAIDFVVSPVNDKPTPRGTIPQFTFDEDHAFLLDLAAVLINNVSGAAFVDIDNDPVTYHIYQESEVDVQVNGSVLSITPTANFNGLASFLVKGYDGSEESIDTIAVLIRYNPVNDVPTISSFTPTVNVTIKEGENRQFSVVAADVDTQETFTYLWQVNGVGQPSATLPTFTYGAPLTAERNRSVTIRAEITDSGGAKVEHTWTVLIENVNQAPTVTITSPTVLTVTEGDDIVFSATSTDPDGDNVTFTWYSSKVATPIGTDSTFTAHLAAGTHEIRLIGSDGALQAEANLTLVVNAKQAPPKGFLAGFEAPLAIGAVAAAVALVAVGRRRR